MQVERDRIVQPDVLCVDLVTLEHAQCEGDDTSRLAPDKEPHRVRHLLAEVAEKRLCQLLEMERRPVVDLEVKRIDIIDDRRDVVQDAQSDWRRRGRNFELLSQFTTDTPRLRSAPA